MPIFTIIKRGILPNLVHYLVLISPSNSLGKHVFRLPIDGTKTSYDRIFRFKPAGMNTPLKSNIMSNLVKTNAAGIDISAKEHFVAL